MKNVELDDLVRVHIQKDMDQCVAFRNYILNDPEGRQLLELSVRGGHSGLGNLIEFYDAEARPILEKFFNDYEAGKIS